MQGVISFRKSRYSRRGRTRILRNGQIYRRGRSLLQIQRQARNNIRHGIAGFAHGYAINREIGILCCGSLSQILSGGIGGVFGEQ